MCHAYTWWNVPNKLYFDIKQKSQANILIMIFSCASINAGEHKNRKGTLHDLNKVNHESNMSSARADASRETPTCRDGWWWLQRQSIDRAFSIRLTVSVTVLQHCLPACDTHTVVALFEYTVIYAGFESGEFGGHGADGMKSGVSQLRQRHLRWHHLLHLGVRVLHRLGRKCNRHCVLNVLRHKSFKVF